MSNFNPSRLRVYYKDNISTKEYANPRKYTLTHSDITGQLFLTIGKDYDYHKISHNRDEVLATWMETENGKILEVFLHLDTNKGLGTLIIRDKIFREELPLALKAIIYAECDLFEANSELVNAPIIVYFKSKITEYNVIENWGKVQDYIISRKIVNGKNGQTQEEILKESEEATQQLEIQYPFGSVSSPYHSAQTPYFHIGGAHMPPSIFPNPNPSNKQKLIEKTLMFTLATHIEKQVYKVFGQEAQYCLKKAEVLNIKEVEEVCPCNEKYEVIIGIRAGKSIPVYNNIIITFLIAEDLIKITKVKILK